MQPGITTLAAAYDDQGGRTAGGTAVRGSGRDEPVLWALRYRKGRVFTTALGHDLRSVGSPGFEATFRRGSSGPRPGRSPSRRHPGYGTGSEIDPPDGSSVAGSRRRRCSPLARQGRKSEEVDQITFDANAAPRASARGRGARPVRGDAGPQHALILGAEVLTRLPRHPQNPQKPPGPRRIGPLLRVLRVSRRGPSGEADGTFCGFCGPLDGVRPARVRGEGQEPMIRMAGSPYVINVFNVQIPAARPISTLITFIT